VPCGNGSASADSEVSCGDGPASADSEVPCGDGPASADLGLQISQGKGCAHFVKQHMFLPRGLEFYTVYILELTKPPRGLTTPPQGYAHLVNQNTRTCL
jgi:hypothetical protein